MHLLLYDRCGGRLWCRVNCSLPPPRFDPAGPGRYLGNWAVPGRVLGQTFNRLWFRNRDPTLVYGHFGTKTLRHQCRSKPKCLGHFGTDHRGSHACQRRQLRSGQGGKLKEVDVYVPLSLNCGFWSQLSGATATSVENASCNYNYCYGVNVQGPLSCRLHVRVHHPSDSAEHN